MTDIVERLRAAFDGDDVPTKNVMLRKAYDEIERLRPHNGGEAMPDYDMSIHTNPDAVAWAKFFTERNPDCGVPEDVMIGWFANAMMAMHDYVTGTKTTVLPDGSAFVTDPSSLCTPL